MAKPDGMFVYVGTYPSEELRKPTTTSSRTFTPKRPLVPMTPRWSPRMSDGKVHVNKDETATRHGAWGGAAVGAVVGILFPPSIIAGAAVGATVGGVGGHLWKGMSRSDVKEFGDIIDAGRPPWSSSAKAPLKTPSTRPG